LVIFEVDNQFDRAETLNFPLFYPNSKIWLCCSFVASKDEIAKVLLIICGTFVGSISYFVTKTLYKNFLTNWFAVTSLLAFMLVLTKKKT